MCTRKQQGFTLTELLIVMVIAAIMAMIALPNMSQWIASRRIASHAERIANLLRFSRGEAVRLNLPVYICPVQVKKDGTANNKCDSGKKEQGMLAFGDKNGNKEYNDTADVLLRSVVLNDDINNKRINYAFNHIANRPPTALFGRSIKTGRSVIRKTGILQNNPAFFTPTVISKSC